MVENLACAALFRQAAWLVLCWAAILGVEQAMVFVVCFVVGFVVCGEENGA